MADGYPNRPRLVGGGLIAGYRCLRAPVGNDQASERGKIMKVCKLCGERMPTEALNGYGECFECVDAAESGAGF